MSTTPPFITATRLGETGRVRHGFFSREGGVSRGIYASLNAGIGSGDDPAAVTENRARICSALGAGSMVSPYQVHGASAVEVRASWPDDARPECDALVTVMPCIALCILSADCVPVLFADTRLPVIGAAHAGWKGALAGVCEATLEAMAAHGSRPGDIVCAIGPAIQQASYEVGPEFAQRFLADDPKSRTFFRPGSGDRQHFDLTGYVHQRLERAGVGHIERLDINTCTTEAYFSNRRRTHRGEPDYGRNASVIVLSP